MLARVEWIDQAPREPRLQGCRIDMPVEGLVTEDRGLEIWGWALGHDVQPRYVAFLTDKQDPVRARVDQQRPDLGARFPEVAAAATSGFRGSADLDHSIRTRLVVSAVWPDRVHTPLGAIYVERFWPDDPDPAIARLVSVVVLGSDELLIQSSIESVRSQSHMPYELVVVAPADCMADPAAARFGARTVPLRTFEPSAAYATAVRRSNGDFLVFLEAGRLLKQNALAVAVAQLTMSPAAAAVLDLGAAPGVDGTPALYRRSAIRAAGPLLDTGRDPERQLLARLRALSRIERLPRLEGDSRTS